MRCAYSCALCMFSLRIIIFRQYPHKHHGWGRCGSSQHDSCMFQTIKFCWWEPLSVLLVSYIININKSIKVEPQANVGACESGEDCVTQTPSGSEGSCQVLRRRASERTEKSHALTFRGFIDNDSKAAVALCRLVPQPAFAQRELVICQACHSINISKQDQNKSASSVWHM